MERARYDEWLSSAKVFRKELPDDDGDDDDIPCAEEVPTFDDDTNHLGDNQWVVEALLGKRRRNGVVEY